MALILNIETSTSVCSVCVAENGTKLIGKETHQQNAHSKILSVFIETIFKEKNIRAKDLDAVAVSKGPGSYTGLRIGVSVAKGMAYGVGIPLISVSTLQNMAWGANLKIQSDEAVYFAPMIDARRMEVYTQLFDNKLNALNNITAEIIDKTFLQDVLQNKKVYFFGDGAAKCKDIISDKNAVFIENLHPSADYMIPFSEKAFKENNFEDVAYFEPFYLKNFIATIPKKNIYG